MDMYGFLACGEDCLEHCGGYVWGLSMWRRLLGALWWICSGCVVASGGDSLEHCGGYVWLLSMWRRLLGALWWLCMGS